MPGAKRMTDQQLIQKPHVIIAHGPLGLLLLPPDDNDFTGTVKKEIDTREAIAYYRP